MNLKKSLILGFIVAICQYLFTLYSPVNSMLANVVFLVVIVLVCSYFLKDNENKQK
ncbi:hypothetical protein ACN2AU_08950 [Aerococcus viridans]